MVSFIKNLKEETLQEKGKDKAETTHAFTAIAIDTENNEFKVINGNFSDKKEFYDRLSKRGLVVRKVLERPIYEWIMKNADTNLDAYAMLSTAFSKWRGNNLLSDDYVQLLNDVPALNRERRKGDPNTKGKPKKGWEESSDLEDEMTLTEAETKFYTGPQVNKDFTTKHDVLIYPIGKNGEIDPKFVDNPIETEIQVFDTTNPKKQLDDPDFYRLMFKLMRIDRIGGGTAKNPVLHPAFKLIFDGNYSEPLIVGANQLLASYKTKNKNPYYNWVPKNAPQHLLAELKQKLRSSLEKATEEGATEEVAALENQIEEVSKLERNEQNKNNLIYNMTKEEQEEYKALKQDLWDMQTIKGIPVDNEEKNDIMQKIKQLEKTAAQRYEDQQKISGSRFANKVKEIQDELTYGNRSVAHGNPNFGGNPFDRFTGGISSQLRQQDILNKAEKIKNGMAKKYMTPQEKNRLNSLQKAIDDRTQEKMDKYIKARTIVDDKRNDLLNNIAEKDNIIKNIFDTKKKSTEVALNKFLKGVEQRETSNITDKMAAYTPFNSDQAFKDTLVDLLSDAEKENFKRLEGTRNEKTFLDTMSKKYRSELGQELDKKRAAHKSKVDYKNDLLYDLMTDKEKEYYDDLKNTLDTLNKGYTTYTDKLKSPEDLQIDPALFNLLNKDQKKEYETLDNEVKSYKDEYADLTNKLNNFEKYTKNTQSLKDAKDKLIADVREREKDKIEKEFAKLDYITKMAKPVKLKSEIKGWRSPEHNSDLLSTYNANKLKKMGYDSSLDMAPYRKTESVVNAGVTNMYSPQPNFPTTAGPIKVAGEFVETTTHSELSTDLFEGDKLKADVREALLKIADKFKETLELPFEPVDIYFTGSYANYNYNEQSDIDLHLVYDFEQAGVTAEILSHYLQSAKKVFNDKYDIKIKNIPVEVGAENLNEPLVSTGIYSVMNDDWIRKPENADTEIANPDMPYYTRLTGEIENAIQSKDVNIIEKLWKKLGNLRKTSLAKEGEFGPGNALFKKLRNLGYLTRLKDAYYDNMSKELSLESLEEID